MNEALQQQISAYVDGELSANESELLVRRLSQDPSLRALAARYLEIGRAVRGEPLRPGMHLLRERIAAELGEQPPETMHVDVPSPSRYLRPVAGVAIAASVAVLGVIGLQQVTPVDGTMSAGNGDLAAIAIDEAPFYTEPPVAEVVSDRPSEMLTRYYQHHSERAADIGGSGVFTRLVALELRGGQLVPIEAGSEADAGEAAQDGGPEGRGSASGEQN
jgi:sigma-E factor negative regulatory protein RseA